MAIKKDHKGLYLAPPSNHGKQQHISEGGILIIKLTKDNQDLKDEVEHLGEVLESEGIE